MADFVTPLNEPEMVTLVFDDTFCVLTLKLAFVEPADTVTLDGTEAAELLLERVTTIPPDGAAALSVTVPFKPFPPVMLVLSNLSEESDTEEVEEGETVSRLDVLPPPPLAEIVTFVEVVTAVVVTVNPALVAPAGTVMLAGTLATDGLLLVRVTASPPLGAAEDSSTVPCEVLPPVREAGFSTMEVTDALAVPGGTTVSVAV